MQKLRRSQDVRSCAHFPRISRKGRRRSWCGCNHYTTWRHPAEYIVSFFILGCVWCRSVEREISTGAPRCSSVEQLYRQTWHWDSCWLPFVLHIAQANRWPSICNSIKRRLFRDDSLRLYKAQDDSQGERCCSGHVLQLHKSPRYKHLHQMWRNAFLTKELPKLRLEW